MVLVTLQNNNKMEIKKNDVLYVVTACRWGDRANHSYVVGVFDDLEKAKDCAESHKMYRGGKYECVVEEMPLNLYDEDCVNASEVYNTQQTLRSFKPLAKVEIGDYVKCENLHKQNKTCLTEGKEYEVINIVDRGCRGLVFYIIDDNGKKKSYYTKNSQFRVIQ